jgi:8-amino-7-oxononanoate synthase
MIHYDQILSRLRQQSLFRELRNIDEIQGPVVKMGDHTVVNFASNDYLGLSQHPSVKAAAKTAIDRYGVGSSASRLVSGSQFPHRKFEEDIAGFKGTESALLFSTGYAAAVGAICSLVGQGDVIILDKLAHACLIDGAKLSGAYLRVFPHNNVTKLKHHLEWAQRVYPQSRILIVTESVFSMDGDLGDLAAIVELKNQFRALLFVDEAHATGVIGPQGSGLVNALGLKQQVEVQMGTLSKAFGVSGGFICGSRTLTQLLVNRARSFIYSTALPSACAAAGSAALQIVRSGEGDALRSRLRNNVFLLAKSLVTLARKNPQPASAIFPVVIGDEAKALRLAESLLAHGFLVPAIRYPTVARGAARIRIALSSSHTPKQIDTLSGAIVASCSQ